MRQAYGVLWVVWAVALGLSFAADGGRLPSGIRPIHLRVASSAILVATAWLTWSLTRRESPGHAPLCIAQGMTLGFLGDAWALVPADVLPDLRLLPAMGLFGLGHIAYMVGFLGMRGVGRPTPSAGWAASWLVWLAVAAAGWHYTAGGAAIPAALRWGALGYSLLLAGTPAISSAVALVERRFVPIAAGSALFLLSDVFLAVEAFRGGLAYGSQLCWGTYGPGQMLIVFGSAALFLARHRAAL